jgi:cytochrome c peroxidase
MAVVAAGAAFLAVLTLGTVFAMQHEATVEKGKALFNDPKLGTTGQSCNDCHKDGRGLEKAGDKKDLDGIVNNCITKGLKGKALKPQSAEMQSMLLYLRGLGKERPSKGRKAPVGC